MNKCDYVIVVPNGRYAPVGSPQRHLPAVERKCKAPAVAYVRPAGYEPGWPEKTTFWCDEHAAQIARRGQTGFVRQEAVRKAVTLISEDHRRKLPFHVYCATCDWALDMKDRVEAYDASKAHTHEGTK